MRGLSSVCRNIFPCNFLSFSLSPCITPFFSPSFFFHLHLASLSLSLYHLRISWHQCTHTHTHTHTTTPTRGPCLHQLPWFTWLGVKEQTHTPTQKHTHTHIFHMYYDFIWLH